MKQKSKNNNNNVSQKDFYWYLPKLDKLVTDRKYIKSDSFAAYSTEFGRFVSYKESRDLEVTKLKARLTKNDYPSVV